MLHWLIVELVIVDAGERGRALLLDAAQSTGTRRSAAVSYFLHVESSRCRPSGLVEAVDANTGHAGAGSGTAISYGSSIGLGEVISVINEISFGAGVVRSKGSLVGR